MKDLYHDYRSTYTVKPQTITSSNANGAAIDLLGYRGCLMVAHIGASGGLLGGANYLTIEFLESSNGVVFSAIDDADLVGGNNTEVINANASANTTIQRSYFGSARYVTVTFVPTAAISLPVVGEVVVGKPIHAPIV
jgi:hypothetical protein